jgi:hypothetical protein
VLKIWWSIRFLRGVIETGRTLREFWNGSTGVWSWSMCRELPPLLALKEDNESLDRLERLIQLVEERSGDSGS